MKIIKVGERVTKKHYFIKNELNLCNTIWQELEKKTKKDLKKELKKVKEESELE